MVLLLLQHLLDCMAPALLRPSPPPSRRQQHPSAAPRSCTPRPAFTITSAPCAHKLHFTSLLPGTTPRVCEPPGWPVHSCHLNVTTLVHAQAGLLVHLDTLRAQTSTSQRHNARARPGRSSRRSRHPARTAPPPPTSRSAATTEIQPCRFNDLPQLWLNFSSVDLSALMRSYSTTNNCDHFC